MNGRVYIFLIVVVFLLNSCASSSSMANKTFFTNSVRKVLESKNIDLAKVQYYIDGDIELEREISKDTAKLASGTVVFQNGKYYQTIRLQRNTPGVCTAVYPNRLNVSFDNDNNKYLTFAQTNGDNYQVINNSITNAKNNIVTYDGVEYKMNIKGATPYLMIKKDFIKNKNSDSRIMKGRKVN
jgi:hypothetical protein